MLPGGADVGSAIVDDPLIKVISFTGSTRAGKIVAAAAAKNLKRVHLELGGNSALIVLDDVDIEKAVSVGAFGSFNHAGQICMATSRHLVAASIAGDYAARTGRTREPPAGRQPDGPTTSRSARSSTPNNATTSTGVVTASVDAGATLAAGGSYEGLFYRPTVLTDVPLTAPAYAEEIFGPVAPVVAFSSARRGRAAGERYRVRTVTGDPHQGRHEGSELAGRIPSGLVHINDQTVNDEALVPFGGVSGIGYRITARRHRCEPRRVHRRAMDHDARRSPAVSVLKPRSIIP